MTAAELIAELQKLPPHVPVQAVLGSVYVCHDHGGGDYVSVDASDAQEVTDVRFQGNHILLFADGAHY